MYQVISSLRSEIDNNNVLIRVLERSINEKFKNLQIETNYYLSLQNSEIIAQLYARISAMEKMNTKKLTVVRELHKQAK